MPKKRCESCGTKIPKKRLKVFPDTTLCVGCKSKQDEKPRRGITIWDDKNTPRTEIFRDEDSPAFKNLSHHAGQSIKETPVEKKKPEDPFEEED